LAVGGVIGLLGHLLDLSSPYLLVAEQSISIVFVIVFCLKGYDQIKALLYNFGENWFHTIFDVVGSLLAIYIFMWMYMKLITFIGFDQLSLLPPFFDQAWSLWSVIILISILPGIFEELAFRGYIMSRLEKVGSKGEAVIIQAMMFSVLHLLPAIFISHFIIGVILGIVRLRSKSIYPSMIVHILWNMIVILEEFWRL